MYKENSNTRVSYSPTLIWVTLWSRVFNGLCLCSSHRRVSESLGPVCEVWERLCHQVPRWCLFNTAFLCRPILCLRIHFPGKLLPILDSPLSCDYEMQNESLGSERSPAIKLSLLVGTKANYSVSLCLSYPVFNHGCNSSCDNELR